MRTGFYEAQIVAAKLESSVYCESGNCHRVRVRVKLTRYPEVVVTSVLSKKALRMMLQNLVGNESSGDWRKDLIKCKGRECVVALTSLHPSFDIEINGIYLVSEFNFSALK